MSSLGVYVRSHEPLGGTAPYLTRPLVIAESADEAYGVGTEFGILVQNDLRLARLPDGLFVLAFDYFNGSRIVVGQSYTLGLMRLCNDCFYVANGFVCRANEEFERIEATRGAHSNGPMLRRRAVFAKAQER